MSATKFLTLRHQGPARPNIDLRGYMMLHNKRLRSNQARTIYLRKGGAMMGDPSWLSQFIKHNSKLIGGALGDIPLVGGVLSGAFNAIVPSNARAGSAVTRPASTGPLGGGFATGGLAPTGNFPLRIGNFDPSGPIDPTTGQPLPPDTTIPTDSGGGTPPVVAIPSSGGGSMLYHHFFGTSKSRAIPVSQQPMRPRGYHINRHGYYLSTIATYIHPGDVWVPNRRRNPLNPRALHRSMSRLISAKHAVKKLHLLDVPRRHAPRRTFARIPTRKQLGSGR